MMPFAIIAHLASPLPSLSSSSGAFLEVKKESTESVGRDEETGEELSSKMVECALRLPGRGQGTKAKDKAADKAKD